MSCGTTFLFVCVSGVNKRRNLRIPSETYSLCGERFFECDNKKSPPWSSYLNIFSATLKRSFMTCISRNVEGEVEISTQTLSEEPKPHP